MRLLKIGHDPSCDIVLYSNKVSKVHAELTMLDNGDILIEDKGSLNGTYVMNQLLMPGKQVNVRRGDRILFADTELQWSQVPAPEDNSSYKAVVGIGTNANNDIQISGATVSRYHATVKVGRDGKVYLIDHSKNGTMVNGVRIPSNQAVQIKKSDSVVCGGVPVNLATNHNIQWPSVAWKKIAAVVAVVAVIGLISMLINRPTQAPISNNPDPILDSPGPVSLTYTDQELYDKYNKSVVFIYFGFHFHASVTGISDASLIKAGINLDYYTDIYTGNLLFKTGTGFFISDDGLMATNLHIAKPWLFGNYPKMTIDIALQVKQDLLDRDPFNDGQLKKYVDFVKVEGVLDDVYIIPNGQYLDESNFIKCRAIDGINGNDPHKDVALLETLNKKLPDVSSYIDESLWLIAADDLKVGDHVVTMGFPGGTSLQEVKDKCGAQCIMQNGQINKANTEYEINYNADTWGGASGSPVFNNKGQLIAVHHAGWGQAGINGNNYGIKLRYLKELTDKEKNR